MNLAWRTSLKLPVLILSALILAAVTVPAQIDSRKKQREIRKAGKTSIEAAGVFNQVMNAPDRAIPLELLQKAQAVAIFPGVINAAFIFGGRGGKGVISRRTSKGWGAPAFFKIGGGSFGLQIGGQKIDYVMLIMTEQGIKGLLEDRLELGGEISVAAGPVGRSGSASTIPTLDAGILSYSRTKGLFAGVSLKGAVISPDNERNQYVYTRYADDILGNESAQVKAPEFVMIVPRTLELYRK